MTQKYNWVIESGVYLENLALNGSHKLLNQASEFQDEIFDIEQAYLRVQYWSISQAAIKALESQLVKSKGASG